MAARCLEVRRASGSWLCLALRKRTVRAVCTLQMSEESIATSGAARNRPTLSRGNLPAKWKFAAQGWGEACHFMWDSTWDVLDVPAALQHLQTVQRKSETRNALVTLLCQDARVYRASFGMSNGRVAYRRGCLEHMNAFCDPHGLPDSSRQTAHWLASSAIRAPAPSG